MQAVRIDRKKDKKTSYGNVFSITTWLDALSILEKRKWQRFLEQKKSLKQKGSFIELKWRWACEFKQIIKTLDV